MTIEEIFNKLISHMIEGTIYHDEFSKAYDFLGLYGYAKCQTYHYMEEQLAYKCVSHYYSTRYFKLLQPEIIPHPEIIPQTWYKYTTWAVDASTRRSAIKELMTKWVEWEKSTKELYQTLQRELLQLDEAAAALYLDQYILDVDKELRHAQKKFIYLESIGYDLSIIIPEQDELYKKYKKKLGW